MCDLFTSDSTSAFDADVSYRDTPPTIPPWKRRSNFAVGCAIFSALVTVALVTIYEPPTPAGIAAVAVSTGLVVIFAGLTVFFQRKYRSVRN